jgi:hypothetical protein
MAEASIAKNIGKYGVVGFKQNVPKMRHSICSVAIKLAKKTKVSRP